MGKKHKIICDGCKEEIIGEAFGLDDDDGLYCEECVGYRCGMGDLAAEAAMEREREE